MVAAVGLGVGAGDEVSGRDENDWSSVPVLRVLAGRCMPRLSNAFLASLATCLPSPESL
eukprot:CAMPEP_0114155506 /NCGR_PEP_ID=MMETSP0043_2-20121206/25518_1 /TAXON_ID=464988 /ORGANISM="Hemiselmis andersenii, Strain CCMP644" /LENGTH=58 /DNA_ID=CAMNT_0001250799 /DNA_START=52 /DNA_END=225 /DNA_ORIENTATION=-